MKKKELKKFPIILIIALILIVVLSIIIVKTSDNNVNNQNLPSTNDNFSQVTSNGTKINVSEMLNADKEFDGLDITNIELTSDGNVTQLTATISNNTGKTKGDYPAKVIFVDSNNTKLAEMGIYIKKLQPGENTILNGKITFDYTNAYNFNIMK